MEEGLHDNKEKALIRNLAFLIQCSRRNHVFHLSLKLYVDILYVFVSSLSMSRAYQDLPTDGRAS